MKHSIQDSSIPPQILLRPRLEIETTLGPLLGDTRIRLLEAIQEFGSISRAAKTVPLSYKAAWDAIDAMNNLGEQPLVSCTVGGKKGGGARLTEYGERMIALFRALEGEYQSALGRLETAPISGSAHLDEFRALLRRMSMRTSARNQFVGRVSGLHEGTVETEVRLRLHAEQEITALITRQSAEQLDVRMDMELFALIKSSSVLLMPDTGIRTSARNMLRGEVTRIDRGPINADVTLSLPGGKSVSAIVTNESLLALGLAVGKPAVAVFKASSVILCAPN